MEAGTIKEGESKKLKSTELHFYIPFIDGNTKTYQMLIIFKLLLMQFNDQQMLAKSVTEQFKDQAEKGTGKLKLIFPKWQ